MKETHHCPKCLSDSIDTTTLGIVGGGLADSNHARCNNCKWEGRAKELIKIPKGPLFKHLDPVDDPMRVFNILDEAQMLSTCIKLASKPCPYDKGKDINGCAGTGIIEDRQDDCIKLLPCQCVIDNLEANKKRNTNDSPSG